jgi:4-hydroxybenzoate polyprenyltransferase
MLIIPVWTVLLLGFSNNGKHPPFTPNMMWIFLAVTGLSGAVFLLNQIFDIESDRINDKVHFLPKGYVKVRTARAMFIILNLISITISFAISVTAGLIGAAIMFLGIAYSAPPFTIKDRAWPALLGNGFGHGALVYLLGYCSLGGAFWPGLLKSSPYFFSVAAVYIGTTLADIEGDRRTGKKTLAVQWGFRNSTYFMVVCYFISLIAGFFSGDYAFLYAALAVAPLYLWLLIAHNVRIALTALKLSIVTLSLAASYYYPGYIIFLAILIFATRFYYKRRFGLNYPSLG